MKYIHKQSVISLGILVLFAFAVTAFAQVSEEVTDAPSEEVVTEEVIISETPAIVEEVASTTEPAAPEISAIVETPEEAPQEVDAGEAKAVQDIATLQDSYFEKTGAYLQVLPGNQLPENEDGSVSQKLGGTLPSDAYVHVYESPKGKGYQVFFKDGNTLISTGFGPEAADRTFTQELPSLGTASSTEAI